MAHRADNTKILLITRDDPDAITGGVETFARHLRHVFGRVDIFAYSGCAGRRLLLNEARDAWSLVRRLSEEHVPERYDLVVANGAAAWPIPKKKRGWPPVVTVYHGTYAGYAQVLRRKESLHGVWTGRVGALLERQAGRHASVCVAVSRAVRQEATRFYGVETTVIENAIRSEVLSLSATPKTLTRQALGISKEKATALFVGRPTWSKGYDLVQHLAAIRPGIQVLAIGGRTDGRVKNGVIELGTLPPGQVSQAYALASIVVLPSRYEGCSFVPIEAAARGVPLAVSNVGEFDTLGRQDFGIVFRTEDAKGFIDSVDEVLAGTHSFSPDDWCRTRHGFGEFQRRWLMVARKALGG